MPTPSPEVYSFVVRFVVSIELQIMMCANLYSFGHVLPKHSLLPFLRGPFPLTKSLFEN